jgi:predicted RNase H-like HicB family nuclease
MRHAVVIEHAEGDYSAYVPDLPGCVATGPTVSAVEQEIRAAILSHIAGQFRVPDDFDDPLPDDVVDAFEGR